MSTRDEPPSPHLAWDADGQPRSTLFDDVYFSREGGLAETKAVFLEGCGLPQGWAGRTRFCVAELGFGTGLNIAALLELWRRTRPPSAHLSIFSVEAHPLTASEAARVLAPWPEIAEAAAALTDAWPGRARGFHRLDLPAFDATLDLAVMDAADALEAWTGAADAWFLDGFAPARNPAMWSERLLAAVAARSAPGARAATYTVAGGVRRGLAAAGFAVERKAGFGGKRERLEARMPGNAADASPPPRIAIIGAGIAGASLARAFAALGAQARVFDAGGGAASANPSALVTPRLDAGLGPPATLFAQGFVRAVALYGAAPQSIIARGALQLQAAPRDARRFETVAASDLFEPGALRPLPSTETSALLEEAAPPGLMIQDGLTIEPAAVLTAWLVERPTRVRVTALEPAGSAWRLLGEEGAALMEADIVCLAAGMALAALEPALSLQAVRGQVSWAAGERLAVAAAFGAYAIPTRGGVLFGATHDRDQTAVDIRDGDTARNLEAVGRTLPELAARLGARALQARAGVRATTPDRLPIAGALDRLGLFALTGLGSRGFTLAPLLAEHVAALALGIPSPLPRSLQALVQPGRFARRRAARAALGAAQASV
jgi:tRNA 5-methylaminomethyl-2-thiouridine biosynthesis bifunctional protein